MGLVSFAPLDVAQALSAIFEGSGLDLRAWALGWARALPAVTLVPAFGLSAADAPTRTVLALALGACIAPGLAAEAGPQGALGFELVHQAWLGLPVAVGAALAIYVAQMAGGLFDNLRGAREAIELPVQSESLPPTAMLFGLFACLVFLETGGAARVASALSRPLLADGAAWWKVVSLLSSSISLALAIAAPLLISSIVLEVAGALVARAANPAFIGPVVAPVKSLALLGVLALVLERLSGLLALVAGRAF